MDQRRVSALQVVRRDVRLAFESDDWSSDDAIAYEARVSAWLENDRARGFELEGPSLMRLQLFRRPRQRVDVVWTMHHAICDGWSSALLLDEVFRDFGARQSGDRPRHRPSPRYRDYVSWLHSQPSSEGFWRGQLSRVDAAATLHTSLGGHHSIESGWREFATRRDRAWAERLDAAARRQRVTLATLVQGAWALLLARYADARQVVFGVTFSGRPPGLREAERMTGLFINSLPVCVELPNSESVGGWLRALQTQCSDLSQHGHVPLSAIQKWSGRPGRPLFDSLLVIENYPLDRSALQSADVRLIDAQIVSRTHYPLSLTIATQEGFEVLWEWDASRFDTNTVTRMADRYLEILEGLTTAAEAVRLEDLRPRSEWSHSLPAVAPFESVFRRFSERARQSPLAEAVRCQGVSLSYAALETWSDAIAQRLRQVGIRRDQRIGLCVERSTALVAALIGIWKAGGAYVPLDPSYPEARLRTMLGDASIRIVVADESSRNGLGHVLEDRVVVGVSDSLGHGSGSEFDEALPGRSRTSFTLLALRVSPRECPSAIAHSPCMPTITWRPMDSARPTGSISSQPSTSMRPPSSFSRRCRSAPAW